MELPGLVSEIRRKGPALRKAPTLRDAADKWRSHPRPGSSTVFKGAVVQCYSACHCALGLSPCSRARARVARARARVNVTRKQMDRSAEWLRTSPQSLRPAGVQGPGERGRDGRGQVSIGRINAAPKRCPLGRASRSKRLQLRTSNACSSLSRSDIPHGPAIFAKCGIVFNMQYVTSFEGAKSQLQPRKRSSRNCAGTKMITGTTEGYSSSRDAVHIRIRKTGCSRIGEYCRSQERGIAKCYAGTRSPHFDPLCTRKVDYMPPHSHLPATPRL